MELIYDYEPTWYHPTTPNCVDVFDCRSGITLFTCATDDLALQLIALLEGSDHV